MLKQCRLYNGLDLSLWQLSQSWPVKIVMINQQKNHTHYTSDFLHVDLWAFTAGSNGCGNRTHVHMLYITRPTCTGTDDQSILESKVWKWINYTESEELLANKLVFQSAFTKSSGLTYSAAPTACNHECGNTHISQKDSCLLNTQS